jgi:uncharacterized membrane protein (UPF0127 family)
MKQVLLPLLGVIIFIAAIGFFTKNPNTLNLILGGKPTPTAGPVAKTLTVGNKKVNIEVADTNDSRIKGLSGRESLGKDSGMLFVFDTKQVNFSFWMKDMLIPLDIVWVSNNKVIKIDKNVPFYPLGTPDNQLKTYNPGQPFDYVLEVNSGFTTTNNIKVGDPVTL